MKMDKILEFVDLFVAEADRPKALRWLLVSNAHGGARSGSGAPTGNKNAGKKNNQEGKNNQDALIDLGKPKTSQQDDTSVIIKVEGYQDFRLPDPYRRIFTEIAGEDACSDWERQQSGEYYSLTLWQLKQKARAMAPRGQFQLADDEWRPILTMWIDFKGKNAYKNQKSFDIMVAELKKLAGNKPSVADAIVRQSIMNGWAGLFALKNNPKTNPGMAASSKDGTGFLTEDWFVGKKNTGDDDVLS